MVQSSSSEISATTGPRPSFTTFAQSSTSAPSSRSGRTHNILMPFLLHEACAVSMRCWSPMRTFAPESCSAKSISSSVHQALNDTLMAPTEIMAANAMIHSGKLRIATATRSPFFTPYLFTNTWHKPSTLSMVCAKEYFSPSYKINGASPKLRAFCKTAARFGGVFLNTCIGTPRTSASTNSNGVPDPGARTFSCASIHDSAIGIPLVTNGESLDVGVSSFTFRRK